MEHSLPNLLIQQMKGLTQIHSCCTAKALQERLLRPNPRWAPHSGISHELCIILRPKHHDSMDFAQHKFGNQIKKGTQTIISKRS